LGHTSYSADAWKTYSSTTTAKSMGATFTRTYHDGVHADLNPKGVNRESRDSDIHPESRLVILCPDVTGSMGFLSKSLVDTDLGHTFEYMVERSKQGHIFRDPHVALMAVGDVECDRGPLQVTQAEADPVTLAKHAENVWIESGGGGNQYESYNLPWYFAAFHVDMDCWEKRSKKGYIFTIGDEPPPHSLSKQHILTVTGDNVSKDFTSEELLDLASQKFEVFHIIIGEGSYARSRPDDVRMKWANLLGQRSMWLSDHTKLAELVVSTIQITEGSDRDTVVKSWGGDTAVVIANATSSLTKVSGTSSTGVTLF
jgi:hypothetical protein